MRPIMATVLSSCFLFGVAQANEGEEACVALLENEGLPTQGCACLAEAASADDALAEELYALSEISGHDERVDAASDAAAEVLEGCFPDL